MAVVWREAEPQRGLGGVSRGCPAGSLRGEVAPCGDGDWSGAAPTMSINMNQHEGG